MTRRHDALIPLTHDHHHALHNCRLLRAAADQEPEDRARAAAGFVTFFRGHSVAHFREEEEEIFPLAWGLPDAPTDGMARILTEHVQIHALVRRLEGEIDGSGADPATMTALADLLRDHIRFEEDVLFPAIERLVPDALSTVVLPSRDRRATA